MFIINQQVYLMTTLVNGSVGSGGGLIMFLLISSRGLCALVLQVYIGIVMENISFCVLFFVQLKLTFLFVTISIGIIQT